MVKMFIIYALSAMLHENDIMLILHILFTM